jgi:hypothetical protein
MLWLYAARNSPLIRNKLKLPFKDHLRFFYSGSWYGYSVQHIHRDYNGRRATGCPAAEAPLRTSSAPTGSAQIRLW